MSHPITPCGELHAGTAGAETHEARRLASALLGLHARTSNTYGSETLWAAAAMLRRLVAAAPAQQADVQDECPFLILGDKDAAECVANGHCGCGASTPGQQGRMQVAGASGSDVKGDES